MKRSLLSALLFGIVCHAGYLEVEIAVSDKKPSLISKVAGYLSDSGRQLIILLFIAGIIVVVKTGLRYYNTRGTCT